MPFVLDPELAASQVIAYPRFVAPGEGVGGSTHMSRTEVAVEQIPGGVKCHAHSPIAG